MNVMKQEVRSLLVGHKNMLNELARVTGTQVKTEKNAGVIVSKIDAVLAEMRAQQSNLAEENRGVFLGMFAHHENIRKQEWGTKDREESLARTTEQAFRMTEQRIGGSRCASTDRPGEK